LRQLAREDILKALIKSRPGDSELLGRIHDFDWLSTAQLNRLLASMSVDDVEKRNVIFKKPSAASDIHILLSGAAQLIDLNSAGERTIVAIVSRGLLFDAPALPSAVAHRFQWEAFRACRVACLSLNMLLGSLAADQSEQAVGLLEKKFTGSSRMFGRYPAFVGLGLSRRLAIVLLELGAEFGVCDARGTLLGITLTHQMLAEMIGASRPKVALAMTNFTREGMVLCEHRQVVLIVQKLSAFVKSGVLTEPATPCSTDIAPAQYQA
jgi:CRP/FNR family transcriptional regulator, cyclic AMP receptor protein